jgi:hypothetical protein
MTEDERHILLDVATALVLLIERLDLMDPQIRAALRALRDDLEALL